MQPPERNFERELEDKIQDFVVKKAARGFGSSQADIYSTPYTRIVAHCLHVPDGDGKIVKLNLTLLKFSRAATGQKFKFDEGYDSEAANILPNSQMHINLHSKGAGDAVKNLAVFLNSQFEVIGQQLNNHKLLVDAPVNIDVGLLLKHFSELKLAEVESVTLRSKLELLREYKVFLENALNENETYIQNWLDEGKGAYRKQRCLIFGLEYIDHKREGAVQGKRFDILTRASELNNEYVLIELKSPSADVFDVKEETNSNGGKTVTYSISRDLARAIPQILQYRQRFEAAPSDSEDLQRVGVAAGTISKCMIVIGERKTDAVWQSHFDQLKRSLSGGIEIVTYTDLINKLTLTISNLES